MSYTLGTQQLALLQIAFEDADGSSATQGKFARAYYQEIGGSNALVMEKNDKPLNKFFNERYSIQGSLAYYKGKPVFIRKRD